MRYYYFLFLLALISCDNNLTKKNQDSICDVVIYGSTPAGIAAAVTANRNGKNSIIIDPHERPGGMLASGISNIDFRTFESLHGFFREFMDSVATHYRNTYGPDSKEFHDCFNGTYFEPKVALRIFQNMIQEAKVDTQFGYLLDKLNKTDREIISINVRNLNSNEIESVKGKIFIDASYEGDLMAMAGEGYVLGAESRNKYNESLAPEEGNEHVMAYNFRVTVTKDPNNRIEFEKPEGYDTIDYPILLDGFRTGRFTELKQVIGIYEMPNKKANLNDRHSSDTESFMLFNETDKWPEATYEERRQLKELARFKAKSYFYFLSHDIRLPDEVRREMSMWGYPKDEFEDNNHFPPWLYVREGRRMVGEYVFTQHDGSPAKGSVRAPTHETGIAVGDYNFNSHGSHLDSTGHKVGMLKNKPVVPYQVPYGVILPKKTDNLLVPVAVSASRIGFSTLRQEPTWTAMGQAAGMASVIALNQDKYPKEIDIVKLQTKLHDADAITFYVSDVPPESKYFNAVQFFGNRGFFQKLYPDTLKSEAGKQIYWQHSKSFSFHGTSNQLDTLSPPPIAYSQHRAAFTYHDIKPRLILSDELKNEWLERASDLFGDSIKNKIVRIENNIETRGDFILELYQIVNNNIPDKGM